MAKLGWSLKRLKDIPEGGVRLRSKYPGAIGSLDHSTGQTQVGFMHAERPWCFGANIHGKHAKVALQTQILPVLVGILIQR